MPSHSKYCRLQVFFVSCQINERDHLSIKQWTWSPVNQTMNVITCQSLTVITFIVWLTGDHVHCLIDRWSRSLFDWRVITFIVWLTGDHVHCLIDRWSRSLFDWQVITFIVWLTGDHVHCLIDRWSRSVNQIIEGDLLSANQNHEINERYHLSIKINFKDHGGSCTAELELGIWVSPKAISNHHVRAGFLYLFTYANVWGECRPSMTRWLEVAYAKATSDHLVRSGCERKLGWGTLTLNRLIKNTNHEKWVHNLRLQSFLICHQKQPISLKRCVYLCWLFADLRPVEVPVVRLVHHVSLTVEPEDVVPDATCSAGLQFVFVSEEFLTSETTSVVETPVSEHTQQGAFPGVYVSHDCHPAVETEQSIY